MVSELGYFGRDRQLRVLNIVLTSNALMFAVQFGAGLYARSSALVADATDMLGDAFVYILSMIAIDRGVKWRAGAALAKAFLIIVFGGIVVFHIVSALYSGVPPSSNPMLAFGAVSLLVNGICLWLLTPFRDHDVNMASRFECLRNDDFSNIGVLLAGAGVLMFQSPWPDIVIRTVIAIVFFWSAWKVFREVWPQFRSGRPSP